MGTGSLRYSENRAGLWPCSERTGWCTFTHSLVTTLEKRRGKSEAVCTQYAARFANWGATSRTTVVVFAKERTVEQCLVMVVSEIANGEGKCRAYPSSIRLRAPA